MKHQINPNETEISNLPDKEFKKKMTIRMFIIPGKRKEELSENLKS